MTVAQIILIISRNKEMSNIVTIYQEEIMCYFNRCADNADVTILSTFVDHFLTRKIINSSLNINTTDVDTQLFLTFYWFHVCIFYFPLIYINYCMKVM